MRDDVRVILIFKEVAELRYDDLHLIQSRRKREVIRCQRGGSAVVGIDRQVFDFGFALINPLSNSALDFCVEIEFCAVWS